MKPELVLLLALLLIAAGAFGIEALGPDGARIVGIAVCLLLLALMAGGMIARYSRGRKTEGAQDAEKEDPA